MAQIVFLITAALLIVCAIRGGFSRTTAIWSTRQIKFTPWFILAIVVLFASLWVNGISTHMWAVLMGWGIVVTAITLLIFVWYTALEILFLTRDFYSGVGMTILAALATTGAVLIGMAVYEAAYNPIKTVTLNTAEWKCTKDAEFTDGKRYCVQYTQ